MQTMFEESDETPCRLVDSSIWIACRKLGHVDALLRMPGIAVSSGVIGELAKVPDGLAQRVEHLRRPEISRTELSPDDPDLFHIQLIHSDCLWISANDIDQVVYTVRNYPDVTLYMRDRDAERVAEARGIPVRTHLDLPDDLLALNVCTPEEAQQMRDDLNTYFR